jgi:hypothetical protein
MHSIGPHLDVFPTNRQRDDIIQNILFYIFREVEKLPWHRRPSQFSVITDRDSDDGVTLAFNFVHGR